MKIRLGMLAGGLLFLFCCAQSIFAQAIAGDEHWDYHFDYPGVTNWVFGVRSIDNKIYTGGYNPFANSSGTNSMDVWDGASWRSLGNASYIAFDYAKVGTNFYVAGFFSRINGNTNVGLARWDGANWVDVGGFKGLVACMAVDGNKLYVGGAITNAGGVAVANVAMWDGTNWSALGNGLSPADGTISYYVTSLLITNGMIYATGLFNNSGGTPMQGIAQWNGTTWSSVGGSLNGEADCMAFDGANLYVGGNFTTAGGSTINRIAKWNGANWTSMGSGANSYVYGAAFLNGNLYIGGSFTNVSGVTATRIAKYNGSSWSAIGNGMNDIVRAMTIAGTNVCIGGYFTQANDLVVNHVCLYDGNDFQRMGVPGWTLGAGGFARAIAAQGSNVYAGGVALTGIGDARVSRVGWFDGVKWRPMGSGVIGTNIGTGTAVNAIVTSGNYVYVGGVFTNAGGVSANNVARWDGTNWSALGGGVTGGPVFALAVDGDNVYVGGSFNTAGGNPVSSIARWNESLQAWFPIPGGYSSAQTSTTFNTIITNGAGGIYAGGTFVVLNNSGGYSTNIAANNGNGWIGVGTAINNGVNSNVNALVTWGGDLYAAGRFSSGNGVAVNRVGKWNGTTWTALGSGLGGPSAASIGALAVVGNYLIAAGSNFTNAGGNLVNVIAAWDGVQWSPMGQGLRRVISSAYGSVGSGGLAAVGNDLYVAGAFDTAGASASQNIAHWNPEKILSPTNFHLANLTWNGGSTHFVISGTGEQYYVVQKSVDLINWTTVLRTNIGEFNYSAPAAGGAQFYRGWWER